MKLIALLITHILCNETAAMRVMPPGESAECSANFEQVKVALNPNLTWDEFLLLDEEQRARVSVESFQYYRTWKEKNPALHTAVTESARSLVQASM